MAIRFWFRTRGVKKPKPRETTKKWKRLRGRGRRPPLQTRKKTQLTLPQRNLKHLQRELRVPMERRQLDPHLLELQQRHQLRQLLKPLVIQKVRKRNHMKSMSQIMATADQLLVRLLPESQLAKLQHPAPYLNLKSLLSMKKLSKCD